MIHFLLDLLAFGAIISSILVITSKNPVISVLFLISVFVHSACYLLVLGVGFVGLSYLIIYVGAITVLFLFVIMMINIRLVDLLEVGSEYTKNLPLGLILTGIFFYEMLTISPINLNFDSIISLPFGFLNFFNSLLLISDSTLAHGLNVNDIFNNSSFFYWLSSFSVLDLNFADTSVFTFLQMETLGQGLYTYGSIWLILMGLILFLAMLGPIVLSIRSDSKDN